MSEQNDSEQNDANLGFMNFMRTVVKVQEENLRLVSEMGEMNRHLAKIDQQLARIAEWIPLNHKESRT